LIVCAKENLGLFKFFPLYFFALHLQSLPASGKNKKFVRMW